MDDINGRVDELDVCIDGWMKRIRRRMENKDGWMDNKDGWMHDLPRRGRCESC